MKTKTEKKIPKSQDDIGTSYNMHGRIISPTMDGPDIIAAIYNQPAQKPYDD